MANEKQPTTRTILGKAAELILKFFDQCGKAHSLEAGILYSADIGITHAAPASGAGQPPKEIEEPYVGKPGKLAEKVREEMNERNNDIGRR